MLRSCLIICVMKIAINAGYGGFNLSAKALKYMADKLGKPIYFFKLEMHPETKAAVYVPITLEEAQGEWFGLYAFNIENPNTVTNSHEKYREYSWDFRPSKEDRADPLLIETIEALKDEASGSSCELKIVEVPDDVDWIIQEYDGWEWVAEKHRTWG
jgi:hypothetical protein